MTAPSVSIDCGAEDSGFFLTGCDISSNEVSTKVSDHALTFHAFPRHTSVFLSQRKK